MTTLLPAAFALLLDAGFVVAGFLVAVYVLWIFYLAVMHLLRVKHDGKLTPVVFIAGTPIVAVGAVLDIAINLAATLVFFDIPREVTLSKRLHRYMKGADGCRKRVACWMEPFLDPFDIDGDHI